MDFALFFAVIFKVYDSDGNGKVAFSDLLDVLRDLTGQFISEQQREVSFITLKCINILDHIIIILIINKNAI